MTTTDIENIWKGSVVQVLKARCRTVGICCCHSHNKLGDTALLAVASPFPARISQRNQIQDDTLQRCTSVHCASVIFQSFQVWMQQREGNTWQHFTIGCSAVIKELNVSGTSVSDRIATMCYEAVLEAKAADSPHFTAYTTHCSKSTTVGRSVKQCDSVVERSFAFGNPSPPSLSDCHPGPARLRR